MYGFMALIAVIIVGVTIGMSYLITDYFFKEKEKELYLKGSEVAVIADYFIRRDANLITVNRYLASVDRLIGARIWLFDDKYELVAASQAGPETEDEFANRRKEDFGDFANEEANERLEIATLGKEIKQSGQISKKVRSVLQDVYEGRPVNSRIFHPYYKEQVLLVGVPLGEEVSKAHGAMLLAAPISGLDKFLKDIYIYTAMVGVVALILSLFLVRRLSKTIVQPLIFMKDSASAIADGDYSRKIAVVGEDEIAELGNSLNSLSSDLEVFVEKTKKMEKLRRDFVANVSHELRTPITIIRGYNEAICDGTVTDPSMIERYRNLINEETVRLERLIKELLDVSRLQISEKAEPEEIPLTHIVRNVSEMLMVSAAQRNIKLNIRADETAIVFGNGDRLVQLVMILGDNAIKYSPTDGIILLEVYKNEKQEVVLAVEDHGPGIPEEDIPYIWERFYKVDKSHCRNIPGTGLGLAIAKEIIRMHAAEVVVHSTLGAGTRFEITFANKQL
ncbi:MAG: ATP-binding protein [Acidaminococcaceae bacterium]